MPFLPPNQQRQSTEGSLSGARLLLGSVTIFVNLQCFEAFSALTLLVGQQKGHPARV